METRINEITDGIFRLSTFVPAIAPPTGFTFNQFLVLGDEPLMFHTGLRKMFPLNRDAVSRRPARTPALDRLRPLRGRRVRCDERVARDRAPGAGGPRTDRLHGLAQRLRRRPPRILSDGETIDLGGGKRVRFIDTPHTPHGWDAGVLYEESTRTLLCGDLFTQLGDGPPLIDGDVVGPAIAAEDLFKYSSLSPGMGTTIRDLAQLSPRTLALMHGPSFSGDGVAALRALADDYDRRTSNRELAVDKIEAA